MHLHTDLITGLPYEDFPTFCQGFRRLYALRPHVIQIGFLKVLKGCPIVNTPYGLKYSSHAPYEVLRTDRLSAKELSRIKNAEHAFDETYNTSYFTETLKYLDTLESDPFRLFEELGLRAETDGGISLENKYRILEGYAVEKGGDREVFRSLAVFDYLSSNRVSYLPPYFRGIPFAAGKNFAEAEIAQKGKPSSQKIHFDYTTRDKVNGKYAYHVIDSSRKEE